MSIEENTGTEIIQKAGDSVAIGVKEGESAQHPPRVLGFLALFAIAYFVVSGGPYGIENAVAGGPPVYILILFIVLPFLWSYPLGMITAELSNAIPQDGGCSVWAEKAFGQYASMSVGLFSWFSNMIDLSLYPVLFVQYFGNCFLNTEYENSNWGGDIEQCFYCRWLLAFIVILLIVACNLWGVEEVGVSSNILAIILLMPFVLMVAIGIWHVDLKFILKGDGGFKGIKNVSLGTIIVPVIWSFSGYDSLGQVAGEVKNAEKNYPRGIIAVMIVSIVTYLLPILVGMQYDTDWSSWQSGQFSDVALKVAGNWLNILMGIGGMASSLGLFNCCLCTVSRNLYSLGCRGYLPSIYSKLVPKRATPWVAILTNATIIGFLVVLPFNSIMVLDMSVYSIVVLFEIASYIKLYLYNPEIHRPFRAVKSRWGLIFIACPAIFAFIVIYSSGWDCQWKTLVVVAINAAVVASRYIYNNYKHKFTRSTKEETESLLNNNSIN
ncbi:hypothetical protein DLAC_11690 [Tieghemostelium lacteum]|uniref:Amino acid/polyamine transporter I n=1 Tax=Tieghemostelium lacteum TaxID=361077 RepID=A0A151ZCX9_TIELA|nr:hypothetical protein DLAC_11690 [Tieghemostelium lacteum]|eukprot:KYQ91806.1 hypothetical protein DLAC_11690 [Tieghemostelium lacteum]